MATIPEDWNVNDPDTWTLVTTVDTHLGYHHTGMVVRELRTIRRHAKDFDADIEPTEEHAQWWADVLIPIHAAEVAIIEASPETMARAADALGVPKEYPIDLFSAFSTDDLEGTADAATTIVAALAARDGQERPR